MVFFNRYSFIIIWLGCLLGYGLYGIGTTLYIVAVLPISFILLPFKKLHTKFLGFCLHSFCAFLTRIALPFLGIYSIKRISGFENIPTNGPTIFVANHQGKLDGPLLLGLLKNIAAIMKVQYASLPVYAALVKHLDFVSIDKGSLKSIESSFERAKNVLIAGKSLLVFPEGTRSNTRRLLPFKDFAFRVAHSVRASIVPVVIYSDGSFMSKKIDSFFPREKITFTIHCLKPLKPLNGESSNDTGARVRKIMHNELTCIQKEYQKTS